MVAIPGFTQKHGYKISWLFHNFTYDLMTLKIEKRWKFFWPNILFSKMFQRFTHLSTVSRKSWNKNMKFLDFSMTWTPFPESHYCSRPQSQTLKAITFPWVPYQDWYFPSLNLSGQLVKDVKWRNTCPMCATVILHFVVPLGFSFS